MSEVLLVSVISRFSVIHIIFDCSSSSSSSSSSGSSSSRSGGSSGSSIILTILSYTLWKSIFCRVCTASILYDDFHTSNAQ